MAAPRKPPFQLFSLSEKNQHAVIKQMTLPSLLEFAYSSRKARWCMKRCPLEAYNFQIIVKPTYCALCCDSNRVDEPFEWRFLYPTTEKAAELFENAQFTPMAVGSLETSVYKMLANELWYSISENPAGSALSVARHLLREYIEVCLMEFYGDLRVLGNFRQVLSTLKLPKNVNIWSEDTPTMVDFHWRIKGPLYEMDDLFVDEAPWFNGTDFLSTDCTEMTMYKCGLTSENLNAFLKKWQEGSFRKLYRMNVHCDGLNEDVVMKGIRQLGWCESRIQLMESEKRSNGMGIRAGTGYLIERNDCGLASILIQGITLKFGLWKVFSVAN